MNKTRVLIVDDHPAVRQGVRSFIYLQEDMEVVGEAAGGVEALNEAARAMPNVVLMDLVMPDTDETALIRDIRKLNPDIRILVLTAFSEDDRVFAAMRAGAHGYIMKDVTATDLARCIRAICQGQPALHPKIATILIDHVRDQRETLPQGSLTKREQEVLVLLGLGLTNKEIAAKLFISDKTVKSHISNILQKLHLSDRTKAALYAVHNNVPHWR